MLSKTDESFKKDHSGKGVTDRLKGGKTKES